MAGLEVQIGADNAELEKKIADSEKLIKKLSDAKDARVKIGADTGDLDKKIDAATNKLNNFKKVSDSVGSSIKNFSVQAANGGNALTQISRIAQDAPFGFIAIGNNITAAGESIGHLVAQTGSLKGAFSAIGTSLAGPGGVLFALSLVTTGLTIMSQKGLTVQDVFDKLSGTFNQTRRDLQELTAETAKDSQAQISSVGAYVAAAKNINLSMSDRLIAVRKLQDEYPAYFGNLTKEQILNGNVATTVKEVTAALIAKAKAAAFTDRIVKLAEDEEKIQSGINNEILRLSKLFKLSNNEAFEFSRLINETIKGQRELGDVVSKNGSKESKFNSQRAYDALTINRTISNLAIELKNNIRLQEKYTKTIEDSTAASIKLEAVKDKAAKKTFDTPQVAPIDNLLSTSGLVDLSTVKTFTGAVDEYGEKIKELPGIIRTAMGEVSQNFDTGGQAALLSLQKFNDNMNAIIQNGIVQTLSGLAEAIGEAFATGGNVVSAVGKSLLSTLGGVLTELGKMAITTGIGILAIKTSLQTLNPYVAIAAGAALIALGGAVKGSVKGLGGSMGSGGGGSTGTSYNTGASYSSPVPSSGGGGSSYSNSGTVVFEIAGDKLIGLLSNTVSKNNRLGGSLNL